MDNNFTFAEISAVLAKDGVGVMPTDTTYGLVGSAFFKQAVERIYELKERDLQKPYIVLINDIKDLEKFSIFSDETTKATLVKVWPGKVTVILSCESEEFTYLHRGTNTLAFRLPGNNDLRDLLYKSGPLVAPSANPQGQPPAESIEQAKEYFGDKVDFYQDGGLLKSLPSTIISLLNGKFNVVRSGAGDDLIKNLI